MSSERPESVLGRPQKPTLAPTRHARTPLTPRVAGNTTPLAKSTMSKVPSTGGPASPRVTPGTKKDNSTTKNALGNGNITPRSLARRSRVDSPQGTPSRTDETPSAPRPKSSIGSTSAIVEKRGSIGTLGSNGVPAKPNAARPRSVIGNKTPVRAQSPLVRSPRNFDLHPPPPDESIDSRFLHAADVDKQELVQKKAEPKKTPTFFYVDGQQEEPRPRLPTSPVLSAVSEMRGPGSWPRADYALNLSKSPPKLSPALSALSSTSPFFAPAAVRHQARSPSPSKENIHLSYRKGASQIFGTRPLPQSTIPAAEVQPADAAGYQVSVGHASISTPQRKSPSMSSIDSGGSQPSQRRSTTAEPAPLYSPFSQGVNSATTPRTTRTTPNVTSIDTSPSAKHSYPPVDLMLSPTKSVSELAGDARRERKLLDLEISNSSLLAINASLEREVRRQKTELKRFRRLSCAGRFSLDPNDRTARLSEALSTLGEDDAEDGDYAAFGPPTGFTDVYDDFSDDDDDEESLTSAGEPLSPGSQTDRLAKDEKRLRIDLAKHRDLLVQSQMMNQGIKRCMYATEEMIKDGNRALAYKVHVSDVKLGGHILHADEEVPPIEAEDDTIQEDEMEQAESILEVWQGVGKLPFEGSEGGDRDSGIEVDKAPPVPLTTRDSNDDALESGRPPEVSHVEVEEAT